jgi:hypothetical protein
VAGGSLWRTTFKLIGGSRPSLKSFGSEILLPNLTLLHMSVPTETVTRIMELILRGVLAESSNAIFGNTELSKTEIGYKDTPSAPR